MEACCLTPEILTLVKLDCLERNAKAKDVAAVLKAFLDEYPEAELRREGMRIVRKLQAIGDSSE